MSPRLSPAQAPRRRGAKRAHRAAERGSVLPFIVFAVAILIYGSIYTMRVNKLNQMVINEKQLLDAQAVIVGKVLINEGATVACGANSRLAGSAERASTEMQQAMGSDMNNDSVQDQRTIECEPYGDDLIVREEGDPGGPPGTFRRYRVSSNLKHDDSDGDGVDREVIVEVREIYAEIERPRPYISFDLDYSGSMSGSGVQNLKLAVNTFLDMGYAMDFSLVLYNGGVITELPMGSAEDGNQVNNARQIINRSPSGGTNFGPPLQRSFQQLLAVNSPERYIVMISDGFASGHDAVVNQIRAVDPEHCQYKKLDPACVTIYTLGIGSASIGTLVNMSGNAATPVNERVNYAYQANLNQTQAAFNEIVEEILCRYQFPYELSETDQETLSIFVGEGDAEAEGGLIRNGSIDEGAEGDQEEIQVKP